MPLQRVIADFGADHAFGQVPTKLQEHYGIQIPVSTIRKITELHRQQMHEQRQASSLSVDSGCQQQIAEIDGCMLPVITIRDDEGDKRKKKVLHWKEARLALVHEQGSVTPKFDATFAKSVDDAGQALLNCAVSAGLGTNTQIHGVGDGATWIESLVCHLEPDDIDNAKAPVRACHRYLINRTDQLNYKGAIEKGSPIGSGEIESDHRYVIQKRLKLSGAWWKEENIERMLALRVVRANEEWDKY